MPAKFDNTANSYMPDLQPDGYLHNIVISSLKNILSKTTVFYRWGEKNTVKTNECLLLVISQVRLLRQEGSVTH